MTFIVTSANGGTANGPTQAQWDRLTRQVDQIEATITKLHSGALDEVVAEAVRPILAEAALLEKEQAQRDGIRLNRKRPANDEFAGVDLNAAFDEANS